MRVTAGSDWHDHFKHWLTRTASATDDVIDAGIRRIRKRLGREGIPKIQPYMGYASADTVHLHGRVLTNPPINPDFDNDRWFENLTLTIQRLASDEVPGVDIEATFGGQNAVTTSDAEGYFHVTLPRHRPLEDSLWDTASLRIVGHRQGQRQLHRTTCRVLAVPADAKYAIISDVDDTILHTGATDLATMAKLTFFGNARTRAPLDGVAKLYEHMQGYPNGDPCNPIFYISSSPWNLYDLLEDFLELNAIPRGPLLLRDLGFDDNKFLQSGHDHKLDKARRLIKTFSHLPFILVGDSGQEDARLYATAATEFPDRIAGIFIRDITPNFASDHDARVDQYVSQAANVGVPMYLVQDSVEAADLAIEHAWLSPAARDEIVAATRRDTKRTDGVLQP
tara:strand:- start:488869 stop:490050 length:1182 start_codon:yes stop_codon:yes gene_type:complete